eukprot:CAMPEP_0195294360 /NCGR_PEP_ID=MMETSP0707-20130614/14750_1 /TAXON_ID=33640 /ORGANISM="Asterionellopsis glacialis, Strain CCMP134" /LENGTH=538 /DNA_ID=CAMNT_0040355307 /DNA_START=50 /DNA_END=1666 /DNA_ORIENTATION=+
MTIARLKTGRDPPSPRPILDRKSLIRALDEADISLKGGQIDLFYQLLHRQNYPSLDEFVANYYRNEDKGKRDTLPAAEVVTKYPIANNRNRSQLPKRFLDFLADPTNDFCTVTSKIEAAYESADKTTTKLAVKLHDGHVVESVIMRYITRDGSRVSQCVSSQVGCAMGCTFCATGTMGIRGNLNAGEILEQIVHAGWILNAEAKENASKQNNLLEQHGNKQKRKPQLGLVRNVVFMGMGEPLNNYDNVVDACRGLIDPKRWNLAHGRVTISTVGVTPRIRKLTRDLPQVSLALSLHAPNQSMRSAIVPAAKAYPIEGLIDALDAHMMALLGKHHKKNNNAVTKYTEQDRIQASKRRRAMIEYVMLEGDTSSFECAHQLGKLCENRHLVVNLIPYNQTDVKDKLRCPSDDHMRKFQDIVTSYGSFCSIRRTMGADIASACGQLVVEQENREKKNVDIEDGPFGNSQSNKISKKQSINRSKSSSKYSSSEFGAIEKDEDLNKEQDGFDHDRLIRRLSIATSIAASCFLVSSAIYFARRRK